MKPIKTFGLAALVALMAMAFVGASSAMAESTSLCVMEPAEEFECGQHVHETTLAGAKAKLLTSILTVECDVLFLGDTIAGTSTPLVIEGSFTYSNCGGCTVAEEGGPVTIEVLKEGHETAKVVGEGEVHVNCTGLNCFYNGEELLGTGKGPLLSGETNGSVTISEQTAKKVKGLFCPSTSKLDITTTPLAATYLDDRTVGHYCVKYTEHPHGFFLGVNPNDKSECVNSDFPFRVGEYALVSGPPGLTTGAMVCVHQTTPYQGLYFTGCALDALMNNGEYELGTVQ